MRTRTIFDAYLIASYEIRIGKGGSVRERQMTVFAAELFRRMDHYDTLVVPPPPAFVSVEGIERYMAGLSDDLKADDILRGNR